MDEKPETGLIDELTLDEAELLDEMLSELGESRRKFIGQTSTAVLGALVLEFLAKKNALAGTYEEYLAPVAEENAVAVTFKVNGVERTLNLDSRVTLLDALRERLAVTGPKKGCDHG